MASYAVRPSSSGLTDQTHSSRSQCYVCPLVPYHWNIIPWKRSTIALYGHSTKEEFPLWKEATAGRRVRVCVSECVCVHVCVSVNACACSMCLYMSVHNQGLCTLYIYVMSEGLSDHLYLLQGIQLNL